MKIGLLSPLDRSVILAQAGFDYIEESVQGFLSPEEPESVFAPRLAALRSAALPVPAASYFLPGTLKCTGPEVDLERIVRYGDSAFRRARQAGLQLIVFGSGASRQLPEGFDRETAFDQFIVCLKRLAPLAERHGVTVVVEAINSKECNFINSLAEGARIVEAVAHTHVRLLVDIYHMLMDDEPPGEIIRYGPLLRHAHVAEREGRMAPGTSGEDFGPYLRALAKIGYQGSISYECNWKHFPEEAAASISGFREQLRQAGLV